MMNATGGGTRPGSAQGDSPISRRGPPSVTDSIYNLDDALGRRSNLNLASDAISYSSLVDDTVSSASRGSWRTSSLIKPSGASAVSGLRRKPSVQPSVLSKATAPAMSRETVSALSHRQREANRAALEFNERLRHNPFLYITSPSFREWLIRKRLILLVLIVNVSIAIVFYQLFG